VVLNTNPRFSFEEGRFKDPHSGKGGFGASSSEWLFSLSNSDLSEVPTPEKAKGFIASYREKFWDGTGVAPSGIDIVSQWVGRAALVDLNNDRLMPMDWPFESISFLIFRTGVKIPTYKHLMELEPEKLLPLKELSEKVCQAFEAKDWDSFLSKMKNFDQMLEKLNLVCDTTRELKRQISQIPGIEFVKGCGAMGADTVLILIQKSEKARILEDVAQLGCELVATENDLGEGFKREN
jgi:mevalonate kinase